METIMGYHPAMEMVIATTEWPGWRRCPQTWELFASEGPYATTVVPGMRLVNAYNHGFKQTTRPIVAFVHDDVPVMEIGWDQRVLAEFNDPKVGLVGFGGAVSHGHPEMYQRPYETNLMARGTFLSNMREAEIHGQRFKGACDAAVLDGFAMFVRREVVERMGGWPENAPFSYWVYDYYLSCMTRRLGYKVRVLGVACDHFGTRGSSFAKVSEDGEVANRYIYDNFRDVLPFDAAVAK